MNKQLDDAEWKLDCLNSRMDALCELSRSDAADGNTYGIRGVQWHTGSMAQAHQDYQGAFRFEPMSGGIMVFYTSSDYSRWKQEKRRNGD